MTTAPKTPDVLVTTHVNADFDAVASAMAAARLHPGAVVVLPGSTERTIRRFLERPSAPPIPLARLREVDLAAVRRLVVVDTRSRGRIGPLADLLDDPRVAVTVFDHHGPAPDDIPAAEIHERPVGANTTLMVALLRERGLAVTPEEATLLSLGIYEDTGSFTFVSTTPADLEAAAWTLEMGADLKVVSDHLGPRLTPQHVALLNDLLETAATYTLSGIPVTVAKTAIPGYLEDFAVLVHELMDMEKLRVLFALAFMEDRVLVVGRSREERVDAGRVLKALGGGGHPSAASATLRGATLAEAEERLLAELHRQLGTQPRVRDVMSYPVLSLPPETPISEVHDALTRYGITVIPLVEEGRILGIISRRTVEKAIYHGLAHLPAREYMTTEFQAAAPSDPLDRVQDLIVQGRQRFVPVVEDGRLVGVMTRTDLLQILSGDAARRPEPLVEGRGQQKNVAALLRERIPAGVVDLLREGGEVAEALGFQVYVVGGFVRDLLLREPNLDVDLVVEGDGIAFARELAARRGGRVRPHEKFGTAVVVLPDGFKVDVATARWEYYEYPAAMPTVALSSIKLDLYRRDFTINTLAVKLNPREFGLLVDFFGGQRDLKDKVIRVLHSLSFVEDPTRVFRAVRFEQRFGFTIGKHTLRLIRNAVRLNVFQRLSGPRLRNEIRHILDEPDPVPALARLEELQVLPVLHPGLRLDKETREVLARTYDVLAWYELLYRPERPRRWALHLLALASGLPGEARAALMERLALAGDRHRVFTRGPAEARERATAADREGLRDSELFALFHGREIEEVLLALVLARSERARRRISRFITDLQDVRPHLRGGDLLALGHRPGPVIGRILERLLAARLDGEVTTREEELALVRREFPAP
ncbi:CBS domain-containing protein [Dissulfurirhabdus thermomarina]|uniref:CBS domain-containing protein n=1 Tax=Dissulfurirhabdus thermomarina TaxID=1765737 RepID=UPI001FE9CF33|nr:CBS domain-containing protein [Dissulfurirhabdus thermomarina]